MELDIRILVASSNPDKARELREIVALSGTTGVRFASAPAPLEVDETGRTYLANARLKARHYSLEYNSAALGDDSGLAVDALGGAPGLYTARFGGPGLTGAERVQVLLDRLQAVPPEQRGAHFVCALCLAFPDGRLVSALGWVHGEIAVVPRGEGGFGYDPVFVLPRLGKTMAELDTTAKHRLSHRAHAVAVLLRKLEAAGDGAA